MNIEYFASMASLEDEDSSSWERIKSIIRGIDLPYTCIIGTEDLASKIALVLEQEGERQDALVYPRHRFLQLNKVELTQDIIERAQRPIRQKREIIQRVFNHFQLMHEWPASGMMSVDLRHLGEYYKSTREIGTRFIITGEDYDEDAITKLTVYGVSLCTGAKEYLDTFLKILKFLLSRYLEMPDSPVVSSEEMVDGEMDLYGDEYTIYEIISREFGLTSGSSLTKSGELTLNVSPQILNYEAVNTIEDYLRIAYYPRIGEKTEANVEHSPRMAIEFVGPEGVTVTKSKSSKQFKYDLFISYSSADKTEAEAIKAKAKDIGLECFLAKKDIKSGKYWDPTIRRALLDSREVVVLVTPESLNSEWVFAEVGATWVLEKDLTPILLRVDYAQLHKLLSDRQCKEYHELDEYLKEVSEKKNA